MNAPEQRFKADLPLDAVCMDILHQSRSRALVFWDQEGFSLFPIEAVQKTGKLPVAAVRSDELAGQFKEKGWLGPVTRSDFTDFVDRLKVISNKKGFDTVLVLDHNPAAVRQALGAAAVFGKVHLLVKPAGKVTVDLHSTINFKSLAVYGHARGQVDYSATSSMPS